jgi:hypothetical protein
MTELGGITGDSKLPLSTTGVAHALRSAARTNKATAKQTRPGEKGFVFIRFTLVCSASADTSESENSRAALSSIIFVITRAPVKNGKVSLGCASPRPSTIRRAVCSGEAEPSAVSNAIGYAKFYSRVTSCCDPCFR